jgi:KUP system potassium uptake protein
VLSAVEGLSVATPHLEHYVVPITVGILVALFMIQKHGTGQVGRFFGPVTVLWFVTLAALGVASIVETPEVLRAVDPRYAIAFATAKPHVAFILLPRCFWPLPAAKPVRRHGALRPPAGAAGLVRPGVAVADAQLLGQGALVLRAPVAIENPFYLLAPDWFLLPLVGSPPWPR